MSDGDWDDGDWVALGDYDTIPKPPPGEEPIIIEPLRAFLERDLPPSEALVGAARGGTNLLPRYGWVMPWGREGSTKTSLLVDLLYHAAAGHGWQHYPTSRPLRFVAVINEGIPGGLQDKLAQKLELWNGGRDAILDNIAVYASPWGAFTFRTKRIVDHAYRYIRDFEADYVAFDPLHTLGTSGAGSPQETEEFKNLLRAFGLWDDLGIITAHHSNKVGMISGDWARHADTVIRLEKDGKNPATKLTLEKARPADPAELGVPMLLEWVPDTMGYRRVELPDREVGDDVLLERIKSYLAGETSPAGITAVKKNVQGDEKRLADVIQAALKSGEIVDESTRAGYYRLRLASEMSTSTPDYTRLDENDAQTRMETGSESGAATTPDNAGTKSAGEAGQSVGCPVPSERGHPTATPDPATTDDDWSDW